MAEREVEVAVAEEAEEEKKTYALFWTRSLVVWTSIVYILL